MNTMNDDKNHPKPQAWIDPALEARIVASVLGETSAFEAAELERAIAENPELGLFKRRIEAVHGLARAAVRPEGAKLQLSLERRQKLLETIGGNPAKVKEEVKVFTLPRPPWWTAPFLIRVAATLVVGAVFVAFLSSVVPFRTADDADEFAANESRESGFVAANLGVHEAGTAPLDASASFVSQGIVTQTSPATSLAMPPPAGPTSIAQTTASRAVRESQSSPALASSGGIQDAERESGSGGISANAIDELLAAAPVTPAQSQTAGATSNVINQPIFAAKDEKVEFDGLIHYGAPIGGVAPSNAGAPVQTQRLLEEAKSLSTAGRYDLSAKRYEETLNVDPYNIEARKGMEQLNAERSKVADNASNETRSRTLLHVDNGWEMPVRRFETGASTIIDQPRLDTRGTERINRKLDEIIIPRIDFQDATLRESLDFLKHRANQLDTAEEEPGKKGVNIALKLPDGADAADTRITLSLTDIPLRTAIDYVAKAANMKSKVEPYAVALVPLTEASDSLISKEYAVPNGFLQALRASGTGSLVAASSTAPGAVSGLAARRGAKADLEAAGVPFPSGASANFLASSNKLIVKNTASNLELIDSLVMNTLKVPESRSRSAEISTARQPFSTFSLHVSDVSFQLAKDALAKGVMPDPARIRPEEFYNAFDYNDPAPSPGEEVACRIEQSAHPFLQQRDLVRIALKVAASGRAAGQPLRLTILLDTSGSMERDDRAASVRRALQSLASLLGPDDRVTLIGFARTPRLLADQVPGDQADKLAAIADSTPSEGGTNLEEALVLASDLALKQKLSKAQNRIVLLTDGAANLGDADPVRLAKQIEKTRQQGISFDACGVGAKGLNDEMLEALTRKGDGRYYFLNDPDDADAGFARQLAGALRPAAENVKVQVVFNPARVSQYRLIGFEKHLLRKEDFRKDKVQAAELSADEAGVALYQVETIPEGEGDLGQVYVRFRDPATGSMVERSWPMPYDSKARAFDQASPPMQLAATAALLAEKLRGDSQVDLKALAPVIHNLRSHYPNQSRVAELIQMYERVRQ